MKRWSGVLTFVIVMALCAAFVALKVWYHDWQSWASYETGSRNTQGTPPNYNYWSGFGSVFPWSMGLIAAIAHNSYTHARSRNCHTHGCWRIGSYPAGDYRVCKRHHFEIVGLRPTVNNLRYHHRLHLAARHKQAGQEQ